MYAGDFPKGLDVPRVFDLAPMDTRDGGTTRRRRLTPEARRELLHAITRGGPGERDDSVSSRRS